MDNLSLINNNVPPLLAVIAGTVIVIALSRYAPKFGGIVVIALTLGMLFVANERGLL